MERMHSEHFSMLPISAIEHQHRYHYAKKFARGTILDAACGIGYGAEFLCAGGAVDHYYGVDNSDVAIAEAKSKFHANDRTFSMGSLTSLKFPDAMFDAVFSFETLEHMSEPEAALGELRRVMKPAGVLVGSVPDGAFDAAISAVGGDNHYHFHRFSRDDLEGMLSAKFTNVQIGYAEIVIGSRISGLDNGPAGATPSCELTARKKSTHGSFYFVCSDRGLPGFVEDVAGYQPYFEGNIQSLKWLSERDKKIAELEAEVAQMRASTAHQYAPVPPTKGWSKWRAWVGNARVGK